MLTLLSRRKWIAKHEAKIAAMIALAESCSRQLRAWADSLQNSEIAGPRHLNEQTRSNWKKRNAMKEGQKKLHEMQRAQVAQLAPNHPFRKQ